MKLSWGLAISSLLCSASAASRAGHVYLYDPVAVKAETQPQSVSPETLRLILARRLGVSQFHLIKDTSEKVLQHINAYGGRHKKLLGPREMEDREQSKAQILVWIEDVEDIKDIILDTSGYTNGFITSNPPAPSDNDRLIHDFALQAESLPKKDDPLFRTAQVAIDTEFRLKPLKKVDVHNDYLTIFHADKSDNLPSSKLAEALSQVLLMTKAAGEKGWPITVVLMPPSSSKTKRSAYPYGTYDLPSTVEARREKSEALLSPSSQPSNAPISKAPEFEDFPVAQQANDSSPVLGILPSCFASKASCETQTHNCSSRGVCAKIREGDAKGGKPDCFSCQCNRTVTVVPGGGMEETFKTTYWGGPACQKKDISIPFWLFVSTGVILAFLISAGIGLLYSMGSEELPSVIGAGVSGPVKK